MKLLLSVLVAVSMIALAIGVAPRALGAPAATAQAAGARISVTQAAMIPEGLPLCC